MYVLLMSLNVTRSVWPRTICTLALVSLTLHVFIAEASGETARRTAEMQAPAPATPLPDNPSPFYPPEALGAAVDGDVVFLARVTDEGRVESVNILKVPAERLGFEEAVREAVMQWRFEPARQEGRPIPYSYVARIPFTDPVPPAAAARSGDPLYTTHGGSLVHGEHCVSLQGRQTIRLARPAKSGTGRESGALWVPWPSNDGQFHVYVPLWATFRSLSRENRTDDARQFLSDVAGQSVPHFSAEYEADQVCKPDILIAPRPLGRWAYASYTEDAIKKEIEGTVGLKAVVLSDGTVGDVTVTESLDRDHGLDEQAIQAAKQWRFSPGTRVGKPVAVLVFIDVDFGLIYGGFGVGRRLEETEKLSSTVFMPGDDGIELPRLTHEVRPRYPSEAAVAHIQGLVWIEAVVLPDGTVSAVRVTKSLDRRWGLDTEAVKAVRQWRFDPGTRFGTPVPVLVTLTVSFALG